jgi:predicted neuraminidase
MILLRNRQEIPRTKEATMPRGLSLPVLLPALLYLPGHLGQAADEPAKQPAVVRTEFIYEKAPFPQCHASTIAQTKAGLVAAWFGGTREKNPDVGIWVSRHQEGKWTAPVEVANGVQEGGKRYPCWNPVLFQPRKGPLLLFYKVGPSPSTWWGMLMTSTDAGKTWSKPRRLPDGIWGPIKDKPIELPDGTLLCGTSSESTGWQVHMQSTPDLGKSWKSVGPLNDGRKMAAIQPTILNHGEKRLQILCRSKHGRIVESWSKDGGKTWTELTPTDLPNPNSGIDAVTLKDGRHLLIYNHARFGRSPLNVAVSKDGKTWHGVLTLESDPGEFSYPAIIQTSDGLVHATYTWKRRRVKHVVIDPARLVGSTRKKGTADERR